MMEVTLNIISRTMFSTDSDRIVAIMERGAGRYQAQMRPNMMDFLGLPAWLAGLGRLNVADRTLGEFDKEIDRLIRLRSSNPDDGPKDLLARLIAARDEQTGGGMNAQEVRDHVITIFMAGHETTAMAMTWIWYLLSQHAGRGGETACRTRGRARRARTRGGGFEQAHLHSNGDRRVHAAVSAGAYHRRAKRSPTTPWPACTCPRARRC